MDCRSLGRGFRRAVVFPLLLAGTLSVTAPVVQGAVGSPGTLPAAVSAPITVPLFTQSTSTGSISHLRVINHSTEAGTVSIVAYDDAGSSYGPATLDIDAGEAVHFNAGDLEAGNEDKGLRDGIGTGTGAWRLELTSALEIEVLSYSRTEDGVVGGMQDVVPRTGSGYRVGLFNPASSVGQISRLRLINRGAEPVAVTIEGKDDGGESPGGAVRVTLPARGSRQVPAAELESGDGEGLVGALGDGTGRWRLLVTADGAIEVMNLLASTSSGAMTNLSSGPVSAEDGDDGATTIHEVGLFPSASDEGLEGVVRIVNRTRQAGQVSIEAIDDTGVTFGPVTVSVSAQEGLVVTSGDLEEGNADKGLPAGTGAGTGDWRLRLSTSLEIEVQSYVHPLGVQDGLLSAMHDVVRRGTSGHQVTLFDPGETPGSSGSLRLINPSTTEADITIRGVDGTGATPGGEVRLTLGAGASREVTVADLEEGTGTGLVGALGDGTGRWHLSISANRRIRVMSLLWGPGGRLANLSTVPGGVMGGFLDAPEGSGDTATAAEVFSEHISERVVHSRCIYCHVEDGRSGHTRLVFEQSTTVDHEALNLATFENFLSTVEGGASRILNKIQGVSHGGGEQVPADSADFAQMERFLGALEGPSEVFSRHISERVVQSRCIYCHVAGGRSGHTRLVFEQSTNPDHEALNLATFESFLSEVESGASRILNKIQGVSHGGGEQVPADSGDFAQMERFLGGLDAGVVPAAITVDTLFGPVRMAPLRKTLRRAALIFAGRVPTEEEYASIYGGARALRAAIRSLMTGPEFHEFLIRGANDRLLTNRMFDIIDPSDGFLVDFINESYSKKKIAVESDDWGPYWDWWFRVQHGVRHAPVELIAHVVENDLPYTEILTADYIMANPYAARAYGAPTTFDDPEDPREFRPSRITKYYRHGEGYKVDDGRVIDPGPLRTDYPHSGVLNTNSFLFRYPTTATNRNRARSRWTYYHFLGVDIEKSASRTTDPVALADTNNPTMYNPACTVCHSVLDPVAGAFQDYGDKGYYKDQWGGMDSLHHFYKSDQGTPLNVKAESWQDRETLTWPLSLSAGTQMVKVTYTNDFWDEAARESGEVYLDRLVVLDTEGRQVGSVEFEDLEPPVVSWGPCGHTPRNTATGREDYLNLVGSYDDCALRVAVDAPEPGIYTAKVIAWSNGYDERRGDHGGYAQLAVIANPYEEGDTWYRDMRVPGFGGKQALEGEDSMRWLARQIVDDRRFAEATVRFWWPAIMGNEVAEPPAEEGDADFEGQLLAANSQSAEVRRLAHGFRQGFHGGSPYNLKDLLVEIVLAKWFRADALADADPVRRVALRDAGARRLLTPEELARKTAALTGYQWGRHIRARCGKDCDGRPNRLTEDFWLLYGGIDSEGITERARNITSVMAGVAQRYAVKISWSAVLREFFLMSDEGRKLFAGVDKNVTPSLDYGTSFEIEAEENWETLSAEVSLPEGSSTVRLNFTNDHWEPPDADRNVRLDRLDLRDTAGRVVASYELENLEPATDCNHPVHDHFALQCTGHVDVPVEVPAAGNYTLEIVARADQAGDELARLEVAVPNATLSGAGAAAIRDKLVELHEKLLGVEVTPYSPDVDAAFSLFVKVMERGQGVEEKHFLWWSYGYNDIYFFEGILDNLVEKKRYESGTHYEWDQDRVDAFIQGIDFSDIHYAARTWVVVLAYLLTDYRYLML